MRLLDTARAPVLPIQDPQAHQERLREAPRSQNAQRIDGRVAGNPARDRARGDPHPTRRGPHRGPGHPNSVNKRRPRHPVHFVVRTDYCGACWGRSARHGQSPSRDQRLQRALPSSMPALEFRADPRSSPSALVSGWPCPQPTQKRPGAKHRVPAPTRIGSSPSGRMPRRAARNLRSSCRHYHYNGRRRPSRGAFTLE